MAAWWRYWYAWTVPALLLGLNVLWLGGLRTVVVGHGSLLSREVAQLQATVSRLELQKDELAREEAQLKQVENGLANVRGTQLRPMREGLIPFLTEVAAKAQEAGLNPERIAYAAQLERKSGLVHFAAEYGVKGTYEQIRKCVYLLETSPQFIVIEGISLRGDQNAASLIVEVQLTVATYFSDLDERLLKQLNAAEVTGGS